MPRIRLVEAVKAALVTGSGGEGGVKVPAPPTAALVPEPQAAAAAPAPVAPPAVVTAGSVGTVLEGGERSVGRFMRPAAPVAGVV